MVDGKWRAELWYEIDLLGSPELIQLNGERWKLYTQPSSAAAKLGIEDYDFPGPIYTIMDEQDVFTPAPADVHDMRTTA